MPSDRQDPTDVLLTYLFSSFICFLFSLSSLIREEISKFRGTPGNHEIHGNPGISTTPGGTLRVFPPRLRVLEISAKFHPVSWIGWGMDSLVMGSGLTVHDPGPVCNLKGEPGVVETPEIP